MSSVLASIGTAAVPAAGIIMLMFTRTVGVPSAGVALILGVDQSWIWLEPPLM